MTRAELEAIRAREQAASPQWTAEENSIAAMIPGSRPNGEIITVFRQYVGKPSFEQDCANALFAANARQDVPRLLEEVEKLRNFLLRLVCTQDCAEDDRALTIAEILREAKEVLGLARVR